MLTFFEGISLLLVSAYRSNFQYHVLSLVNVVFERPLNYRYIFSVALVEGGYACSHFTAEKSNYGRLIAVSEENAKRSKEKRWVI